MAGRMPRGRFTENARSTSGRLVRRPNLDGVSDLCCACLCLFTTHTAPNGWVRDNSQWVNPAAKYYNIDLCLHFVSSSSLFVCAQANLSRFSIQFQTWQAKTLIDGELDAFPWGRTWAILNAFPPFTFVISNGFPKNLSEQSERANSHKDKQRARNNNRLAMAHTHTHTLVVCTGSLRMEYLKQKNRGWPPKVKAHPTTNLIFFSSNRFMKRITVYLCRQLHARQNPFPKPSSNAFAADRKGGGWRMRANACDAYILFFPNAETKYEIKTIESFRVFHHSFEV